MDPIRTASQVKILCEQMPIKDNVVCLLHYGSVKNKEDFNSDSDLDFHLVLKEISKETLRDIKSIFGFSKKIDLSFHSLDEILYKNNIIFQNGNQGIYFMHVLASSEVLVGSNIYIDLVGKIKETEVRRSIIEKIRYYLWFLRKNYVLRNNIKDYKKYFLRIIKDILILDKIIDYLNISKFTNHQVVDLYIEKYNELLSDKEKKLVIDILSLENIADPEIEEYLLFFSREINKIVWKNLK